MVNPCHRGGDDKGQAASSGTVWTNRPSRLHANTQSTRMLARHVVRRQGCRRNPMKWGPRSTERVRRKPWHPPNFWQFSPISANFRQQSATGGCPSPIPTQSPARVSSSEASMACNDRTCPVAKHLWSISNQSHFLGGGFGRFWRVFAETPPPYPCQQWCLVTHTRQRENRATNFWVAP